MTKKQGTLKPKWTKAQLAHLDKVLKTTKWTKKDWLRFRRLNAEGHLCHRRGGRYYPDGDKVGLSLTEVQQRLHKPGFEKLTRDCEGLVIKPRKRGDYDIAHIIKVVDAELKLEKACPRCGQRAK